jgi:hypothetical protein
MLVILSSRLTPVGPSPWTVDTTAICCSSGGPSVAACVLGAAGAGWADGSVRDETADSSSLWPRRSSHEVAEAFRSGRGRRRFVPGDEGGVIDLHTVTCCKAEG